LVLRVIDGSLGRRLRLRLRGLLFLIAGVLCGDTLRTGDEHQHGCE
jgi:hypothetical protein